MLISPLFQIINANSTLNQRGSLSIFKHTAVNISPSSKMMSYSCFCFPCLILFLTCDRILALPLRLIIFDGFLWKTLPKAFWKLRQTCLPISSTHHFINTLKELSYIKSKVLFSPLIEANLIVKLQSIKNFVILFLNCYFNKIITRWSWDFFCLFLVQFNLLHYVLSELLDVSWELLLFNLSFVIRTSAFDTSISSSVSSLTCEKLASFFSKINMNERRCI